MITLSFALALCLPSHTPEEIEHLRTKTAYLLQPGKTEVNLILSHLDDDDFDRQAARFDVDFTPLPTGMFELDFAYANLDAETNEDDGENLDDTRFSFKFETPLESPVRLASGAGIILPTGNRSAGIGEEEWGIFLYQTASSGAAGFDVHGELGLDLQMDRHPVLRCNVAMEREIDFRIRAGAAINLRIQSGARTEAAIVPGVSYESPEIIPQAIVTLGVGLPIGLTDATPDWGILINFGARF